MTSVCQSTSRPWNRLSWRATASRSSGTPIIGGYWFGLSASAAWATATISGGPFPSGNPCPRLIEPCSMARRDITSKTVVP